MTFLVQSEVRGRLSSGAVYLFNAGGLDGCLGMNISPIDLAPGTSVVSTVQIDVVNQFCPMPLVVDRMTFTVYGEESLRSAQDFQVGYTFLP
jgi:hypothetical protein